MLFASAGSPGRWSCFSRFPTASPRCWVGLINLFLTRRIGGKPVHLPAPVACSISPAVMLPSSTWPLWSWAPSANSGTKDSNMFHGLWENRWKIIHNIFAKVAETWFLSSSSWQLFSARASSCRRLPTSRWSSSFCKRKRGQTWVKNKQEKSKGAKKGKIGDERPSIKWSEAFHIFQSGQAWLTQGDKRRGKEQLRRQTQ